MNLDTTDFPPQDPYNMERVFWLLSGWDGALVKAMMEEFQQSHRHTLPEGLHKQVCSTHPHKSLVNNLHS